MFLDAETLTSPHPVPSVPQVWPGVCPLCGRHYDGKYARHHRTHVVHQFRVPQLPKRVHLPWVEPKPLPRAGSFVMKSCSVFSDMSLSLNNSGEEKGGMYRHNAVPWSAEPLLKRQLPTELWYNLLCAVIAHFEKGTGPHPGGTILMTVRWMFCMSTVYDLARVARQARGGTGPGFRGTSPPCSPCPPMCSTRYTATAGAGSNASDVVPLSGKSAPTCP